VAAKELAECIQYAESPPDRLFTLMGMAQTGEHGLAAARRLRAGGGITGLVTVAWLVEQEAIDADAVTPEEATVGMTDHFAALHELDSFRSPRFTCSRRSTTRAASNYWNVIATDHPEKKLAKLAWRARLKLRTAGSRGQRQCGWLRGRRQCCWWQLGLRRAVVEQCVSFAELTFPAHAPIHSRLVTASPPRLTSPCDAVHKPFNAAPTGGTAAWHLDWKATGGHAYCQRLRPCGRDEPEGIPEDVAFKAGPHQESPLDRARLTG
jgi:hypothetical protein